MKLIERIATHKIILALPVVGMAAIYMWQPISDYFLTGSYDENVVLQIETEANKIDADNQLLVLHIKPLNRGSVPVNISGDGKRGKFTLEVKRIDEVTNNGWVEQDKLELVNKADILRHYKDGYTIEPSAFYDEVEAIKLKLGTYWVNAKLTFDDGDYINESAVVKLSNE